MPKHPPSEQRNSHWSEEHSILSEKQWEKYMTKREALRLGASDIAFTRREAVQFLLDKADLTAPDLIRNAQTIVRGRAQGAVRSIQAQKGGIANSLADFVATITEKPRDFWLQKKISAAALSQIDINRRLLFSRPEPETQTFRMTDHHGYKQRYEEKIAKLASRSNVKLTPGEYLRFVLSSSDISETSVRAKLGVNPYYFPRIFRRNTALPYELARDLASLSGEDISFWQKREYALPDDKIAAIDLTRECKNFAAQSAYRRREEGPFMIGGR